MTKNISDLLDSKSDSMTKAMRMVKAILGDKVAEETLVMVDELLIMEYFLGRFVCNDKAKATEADLENEKEVIKMLLREFGLTSIHHFDAVDMAYKNALKQRHFQALKGVNLEDIASSKKH